MIERITASADTLMRQASMTASDYMRAAVHEIDAQFGKGYAKAHPELVAAFMSTAAQDFHTGLMAATIQDLSSRLGDLHSAVGEIAQAIHEHE